MNRKTALGMLVSAVAGKSANNCEQVEIENGKGTEISKTLCKVTCDATFVFSQENKFEVTMEFKDGVFQKKGRGGKIMNWEPNAICVEPKGRCQLDIDNGECGVITSMCLNKKKDTWEKCPMRMARVKCHIGFRFAFKKKLQNGWMYINEDNGLQPSHKNQTTYGPDQICIAEEIKLSNEDCKGHEGWTDKNGQGCDVYNCNRLTQADIDGRANDGCSASQVCPGCVAGLSMCANTNDQKQNDSWRDNNFTCDDYEFFKYCTNDKKPGNGWHTTDWGNISEIVGTDGRSPLDACCACGAGSGIESTTRLLKD